MSTERICTLLARKLSGEATQAEVRELDDLLLKFPEAGATAAFINTYWNLPPEKDLDFLEATYHLHTQRLKERGYDLEQEKHETGSLNLDFTPRKNKKRKLLLAGAALSIILLMVFFSVFNKSTHASDAAKEKIAASEVSTKNGSRTKIQLPDGTSVSLNSNSKLVYDNQNFGQIIREVTLVGEAYFDVVKNPAKPFVIHTAKMDIKVLGTAFNVKCYPDDKTTETSLIRGSIEVTLKDRADKIMMKPNDKLIINNGDAKIIRPDIVQAKQQIIAKSIPEIALKHLTFFPADSTIVETGWVENRLVFSEESLEDLAKKMERWYGVKINITNESLKKELLTGSFETETITQALDALQLTTAFNYKVDKNVITISK